MDKGYRGEGDAPAPSDLLRTIALEAIAACDAGQAVTRAVAIKKGTLLICGRPLRATPPGRVLILAVGKAAGPTFNAFAARLREAGVRRPVAALVIGPSGSRPEPEPRRAAGKPRPAPQIELTWITGDHPVPLRASFRAGKAALRFLSRARKGDDVVALISGGGSSLMAAPLTPYVTPADKTLLTRLLLVSGAPIASINAVRKHLSSIKGGRLAVAAQSARSLSTLVVCDVDPARYEDVASGPMLPDRTTLDDLVAVTDHYGVAPALPSRVLDALRSGRLPETPKPKDALFRKSRSQMLLSNAELRNAAVRAGLMRGLAAEAMPTEISGPVEEAVEKVARVIEAAPTGLRLLVLGGEATTAPAVPGKGGRSQEFALRLALRMRGLSVRGWAFLACGSDGQDGSSPAAGAYVDPTTLERARALRLDPEKVLARSDTWRLFHRLNDTLVTGPTGTNVRDLYLLLTGLPHPGRRA